MSATGNGSVRSPRWAAARRAWIGTVVGVLGALSCTEQGPSAGGMGVFLDVRAALAPGASTTSIAIDRVIARAIRPPDEILATEELPVEPGQQSVELGLRVTLNAEQEELIIRIEMWTGDLLRYSGEVTMLVDARQSVNRPPTIQLGAVSPALEATAGPLVLTGRVGPVPLTQRFSVSNVGGASFQYSAAGNRPWLTVSPASGILAPGLTNELTASVDASGLQPGVHEAAVTVSAAGTAGSPVTIPVEVRVETEAGFSVSPPSLVIATPVGTNPAARTIVVTNGSFAPVTWSASDDADWLAVSPASGMLAAGASQALTVDVTSAPLSTQTYGAMITVTPSGANPVRTVGVQLNVTAAAMSQLTVLGGGTGGGTVTSSDTQIRCDILAGVATGNCTRSYAQGTAVTLTAQPLTTSRFAGWSGACTGTGTCQVSLSAARTVTATFERLPATIQLPTVPVVFMTQQGTNPADRTLRIANTGGATLNWSATDDAPWLDISPASGTVAAGANQTVAVSVSGEGLTAGTYTATITVTDPAAANSPQTVPVSLMVTTAPTFTLTVTGAGTGEGTVLTDGFEISCDINAGVGTGDCSQAFAEGTVVALDVIPYPSSTFTGWSGACTGAGACEVTMDQARAVTATFALIPASIGPLPASLTFAAQEGANPADQPLEISNTGGATLTWTASDDAPWLSVTPASGGIPGSGLVAASVSVSTAGLTPGTYDGTITITAPGATNSPQTVPVQLTVSAIPTYVLTVNGAGTGLGAVTDYAGINCTILEGVASGACSDSYAAGTEVTLTAIETSDTHFVGWSGACAGPGACVVTMDQARSVTATFVGDQSLIVSEDTLTVQMVEDDAQSLFVDLDKIGSSTLPWTASDDAPWLTVSPASGTLTGPTVPLTIDISTVGLAAGSYVATITIAAPAASNSPQTISVQLTVTAAEPEYTLTVTGAGHGVGEVSDDAESIICSLNLGSTSGTCSASYPASTVVTLTASPDPGSTFVGWSGACTGPGSCQVTMDQARAVTATINTTQTLVAVPSSLTFGAEQGTNPPAQDFDITAIGNQYGVSWTASSNAPWLVVAPTSGNLSGTDVFSPSVIVTSDDLDPGLYIGTITVSSPDVVNSPQTVDVSLTVTPAPAILTILKQGAGTGYAATDPAGIDCDLLVGSTSGTCQTSFDVGTEVSLYVLPDEFMAVTWGSPCEAAVDDECIFTITGDTDITVQIDSVPNLAPVLSNLQGELVMLNDSSTCSINFGSFFSFTMDYTDPDGDVNSSTAYWNIFQEYLGGESGGIEGPAGGGVSGDGFSGQLSVGLCLAFDASPSVTNYFVLLDEQGNPSNEVSLVTDRPVGGNSADPATERPARAVLVPVVRRSTGGAESPPPDRLDLPAEPGPSAYELQDIAEGDHIREPELVIQYGDERDAGANPVQRSVHVPRPERDESGADDLTERGVQIGTPQQRAHDVALAEDADHLLVRSEYDAAACGISFDDRDRVADRCATGYAVVPEHEFGHISRSAISPGVCLSSACPPGAGGSAPRSGHRRTD